MSFDIDRVITVMRDIGDVAQKIIAELRRLRIENAELRAKLGDPKAEEAITQILDHIDGVVATVNEELAAPAPEAAPAA